MMVTSALKTNGHAYRNRDARGEGGFSKPNRGFASLSSGSLFRKYLEGFDYF